MGTTEDRSTTSLLSSGKANNQTSKTLLMAHGHLKKNIQSEDEEKNEKPLPVVFGTRRAGLSTSPGDAVTSGPTTYHPSERSRTTVRNTLPNTTTSCGPPPSHTAGITATQNYPITEQNPPPTLCVGKECRHRCVSTMDGGGGGGPAVVCDAPQRPHGELLYTPPRCGDCEAADRRSRVAYGMLC